MVLAQREEINWALNDLAEVTIGITPAFRAEYFEQLRVTVVAICSVKQGFDEAARGFTSSWGVKI